MRRAARLLIAVLLVVTVFPLVPPTQHVNKAHAFADNNIQWGELGHNSRDPLYRSPSGAVPTNTPIRIRFRALNGDLTGVTLRVWNDRADTETLYPMTRVASNVILPSGNNPSIPDSTHYEFWEYTLPASPDPTVYWYRFIVQDGTDTDYYADDATRTGGWGTPSDDLVDNSWQLSIYQSGFHTPDWVKNAVFYQIFPDRFRDGTPGNNPTAGDFFYGNADTIVRSNTTNWNTAICNPRDAGGPCPGIYAQNFYGGDLQGIINQLSYIQGLGITALYLNPIFESPSNHKYDTFNFMQVDNNFGTLATLQDLADTPNLRLILDGVFNHSSSDSLYFDRYQRWTSAGASTPVGTDDDSGACESLTSTYTDWYTFFPYTGSGDSPCSDNRDYPKWFGIFDSLPVFQHDNPEVRDYFIDNGTSSVGPYWVQWTDGWRLDVAPEIDPGPLNDTTDDYWEDFRTAVHAVASDAYIVGEEWGNPTSWILGQEWDSTMNYQFSAAVLSFWRSTTMTDNDYNSGSSAGPLNPLGPSVFNERMLNLAERYPSEAYYAMLNLLDSHDTNRALFLLDPGASPSNTTQYDSPTYNWSPALQRMRGAALIQLTMPGAPSIYYGDEVGLVNPPGWDADGNKWQDDPYNRAPYPWLDQSGTPFYTHMQSGGERTQQQAYYTTLISARNANAALRTGSYDPLLTDDTNGVLAYGRKMSDDSNAAVVILNNSGSSRDVVVDLSGYIPADVLLNNVLDGGTLAVSSAGTLSVTVPAYSGKLFVTDTSFAGTRPGTITNLVATGGESEVQLNWTVSANTTEYTIYRSQMSGGGYLLIDSVTTPPYDDVTVVNSVQYYYKVVPTNWNTLLEGPFSNEAPVTPQYNMANAWYDLSYPATIGASPNLYYLSAITPTTQIFGTINIGGVTDMTAGPVIGITAQVGYGTGTDPSVGWTWFPMTFNADIVTGDDEYVGTLLPTANGTFRYTTRWSSDGGIIWHYTDLNGSATLDPAQFGTLTVTLPGDRTPPTVPTGLIIAATSPSTITLGWNLHPNAARDLYGFQIWRQDTTVPEPALTYLTTVTGATTRTFIDTLVTTNHTYNYVIKAMDNSRNLSAASNQVTAKAEFRPVAVTFNVTVPAGTPGPVYLVGSLGAGYPSWDPGASSMAMTQVDATHWRITLSIRDTTHIEYKFARGSWNAGEKLADGFSEVTNRPATIAYGMTGIQALTATVANWRDPFPVTYTPASGASGQSPDARVIINWNQPMVSTPANITLTGPNGLVAGTFSYTAATRTHTFTPNSPLDPGSYTVNASGNVDDAGGDTQQVPYTWTFAVSYPLPGNPTLVAPANNANVATTLPLFTWGAVVGATQYQWQIDDTFDMSSPLSTQIRTVTNYTAPVGLGLQYGNTYYWRVRAGSAASVWSNWSPVFSFNLTVHTLPANATFLTTNKPTFTWASMGVGVTYRLELDDNLAFSTPETLYTGLNRTYIMPEPGLLALGQYYWRVCVNTTCMQPWTFTITITPPSAPLQVNPAANIFTNDNTPDFSWHPLSPTVPGGPFDYQIQVDDLSTFASPAIDVRQAGLTFTPITSLSDGVYYWRVRAINNADTTGTWSLPRAFTVDIVPPANPVLVNPADRTYSALPKPTFTWAASVGAVRYRISLYTLADDCSTLAQPAFELATLAYIPPANLTNPGGYCWYVQAQDRAGNWSGLGIPNRLIRTATLARPLTPVPTGPTYNSLTQNSLPSFSWTGIGTLFELQLDDLPSFASPLPRIEAGSSPYIPGTPLPDGRYYWRVRAVNADGVAGLWSAIWVITIDTTDPAAPALLTPGNGSTSVLTQRPTFTWGAVPGAVRYQIVVDDSSDLLSSVLTGNPTTAAYIPPTLTLNYGTLYYWQVKAYDAAGNESLGSNVFTFTPTAQRTPADNSNTAAVRPIFTWQAIVGATYNLTVDNDANLSSPIINNLPLTTASYTIAAPGLSYGTYYWRLTVNGVPMPIWSLHISPTAPLAPVQTVPVANAVLRDNTPTFQWNGVTGGARYQIQIDNDATFASPVQDTIGDPGVLSHTASLLPNGPYYWRVRALNSHGAVGAWSLSRLVTIDIELPAVPVMLSPASGASVTNRMLVLSWQAVTGATAYEVRIDDTSGAFTNPPISTGAVLSYRPPTPLTRGTYYWQVRALDAAGNASAWSSEQSFIIVAGITVASEPSTTLLQVVEAETLAQSGTWISYDSDSASGGRYVYSSGSTDDTLSLNFTGTQADVVYIQHPALGSFAIEIDGVIAQTVTTTSDQTIFGARASITGLRNGSHTLRIVPVSGTIAIDALAVELQSVTPEVTDITPTIEVTVVPTETVATEVPTELPPTATPLPPQQLLESDVEIVQRAGVWTAYATDLASGGAYLYSSGSLSDTLSVTFSGTQIDVIYVQHPALGMFALEVDGSVTQIIDAYAADTIFGVRASVTVPAGQHTLRLVPISGMLAIDAFALDAQAAVIMPTIVPTVLPPTDIPPTATPIPVTLPLIASFDTPSGWTPAGLWTLDPAGYAGTGWFVSSATRGQTNTLTFDAEIDLRMAFYPHLTFWQRGQLTPYETLTLNISQDNGQSWVVVDLGSSITADWTLYDLDLTPFAGQIIRLRFQLDATQALPDGVTSMGWWLDELAIQEVPPVPPTVEPTLEPTLEPPTEIPTEVPLESLPTEEVTE